MDAVQATVKGMPAVGVLREGDVIVAVDGHPVTCHADAGTLIKARKPGAPVELTVLRQGRTEQVRLVTADAAGEPVIGVNLVETYVFPFSVTISVGDIGGPSAGLMFALGIIDKLTPANLTGGRFIAGTGEIEADGTVDPIGGIQQKWRRSRGRRDHLPAPATNCPTPWSGARRDAPDQGQSLTGAIADLNALKAGRPVPRADGREPARYR